MNDGCSGGSLARVMQYPRVQVSRHRPSRLDSTHGAVFYKTLLTPGAVSLIDLSDSGMSELTNIVIADLLRGVQAAQDDAYQEYEKSKSANSNLAPPTRTVIIIEEAHEFLSEDRIEKTKILFQ